MRLLPLLIHCAAALAIAAPAVAASAVGGPLLHDLSAASLRARDSEDVDAYSHSSPLTRLLSRDSSVAYERARRAAGGSLRSGTYYYFMNCQIGPDASIPGEQWPYSGCGHVGLVIGKTSRFGRGFTAVYIHIRLWSEGWVQGQRPYTPYVNHRLVYGGITTASKADIDKLMNAGQKWLDGAGKKVTKEYHCGAHYRYLASLLS
ncbi:hypothetical protein CSUB01_10804 [Colletotrichum sublineola]|uniref:Uncharacterized protein n=1 Tax=Colletotrichum sublineola TaxID=1173701 RepID=A0A066XPF2_COLSU|nr:hypothetical protein CSUB01_10804 [Colletotrichum sublineola]